jgi:hypothetical protein
MCCCRSSPSADVDFSLTTEGSFGWRAEAPFFFGTRLWVILSLREALASRQLDAFVREQQDDGAELVTGSELERGLALLIGGPLRSAAVALRFWAPFGRLPKVLNCSEDVHLQVNGHYQPG